MLLERKKMVEGGAKSCSAMISRIPDCVNAVGKHSPGVAGAVAPHVCPESPKGFKAHLIWNGRQWDRPRIFP